MSSSLWSHAWFSEITITLGGLYVSHVTGRIFLYRIHEMLWIVASLLDPRLEALHREVSSTNCTTERVFRKSIYHILLVYSNISNEHLHQRSIAYIRIISHRYISVVYVRAAWAVPIVKRMLAVLQNCSAITYCATILSWFPGVISISHGSPAKWHLPTIWNSENILFSN